MERTSPYPHFARKTIVLVQLSLVFEKRLLKGSNFHNHKLFALTNSRRQFSRQTRTPITVDGSLSRRPFFVSTLLCLCTFFIKLRTCLCYKLLYVFKLLCVNFGLLFYFFIEKDPTTDNCLKTYHCIIKFFFIFFSCF